jgi:transposase-like protein
MNKATKKPFIRRTDEEKHSLIQEWEKSGLSIASFCRQHNLADSQFYSWKKNYQPQNSKLQQSEFIPLQITAAPAAITQDTPSLYAELVLAGGASIKFYQPVTATYLRTLIS